jgi:hypothetical protein
MYQAGSTLPATRVDIGVPVADQTIDLPSTALPDELAVSITGLVPGPGASQSYAISLRVAVAKLLNLTIVRVVVHPPALALVTRIGACSTATSHTVLRTSTPMLPTQTRQGIALALPSPTETAA